MTLRPLVAICAVLLLSGCIRPYHMEIGQGNIITQETVDQLRPGMTRAQVRFLMGTPLIADPFHADRWDYFYSLRRSTDKTLETRHITLTFKNDVLTTVEGDVAVKKVSSN